MEHPAHREDTTRARHESTHLFPAKQSVEQRMGTGSTGVHPLLCSTQPLQQGFECFLAIFKTKPLAAKTPPQSHPDSLWKNTQFPTFRFSGQYSCPYMSMAEMKIDSTWLCRSS